MGCAVNGPGEAAEAELGFAAGGRGGLLYRDGKVVGRVQAGPDEIAAVLAREVEAWAAEKGAATPGASARAEAPPPPGRREAAVDGKAAGG